MAKANPSNRRAKKSKTEKTENTTSQNTNEFGYSLSSIIEAGDMSVSTIATVSGMSPNYLYQLLTGRRHPSPAWIDAISNALGLPTDKIFRLHVAAARDRGFKIHID